MAKLRQRSATSKAKRSRNGKQAPWSNNTFILSLVAIALAIGAIGYAALASKRTNTTNVPLKRRSTKPPPGRVWKLVDTTNGRGVVATQDLEPGALIILDMPLLEIPMTENRTEGIQAFFQSFIGLSTADKADFLTLAHNPLTLPENHTIQHLALNIFETNAFRSGSAGEAVYRNACRINHSCRPNADHFFRDDLGALVVHAIRPIKAGEEIFHPYFDPSGHTFAERQEYLHEAYGFDCQCETCALNEVDRAESDRRRSRIAELRKVVIGWSEETVEPEEALAAIEEALFLLDEEGYAGSLGSWAANAMQINAAHSDEAGVRKWGALAARRYAIETGTDSVQLAAINSVMAKPELGSAWGKRDPRVLSPP